MKITVFKNFYICLPLEDQDFWTIVTPLKMDETMPFLHQKIVEAILDHF